MPEHPPDAQTLLSDDGIRRMTSEGVSPNDSLQPHHGEMVPPAERRRFDDSLMLDGVYGGEEDITALTRSTSQMQSIRLRRTPVWGATANTIAFMCVPRSVPACFKETGWVFGVAFLLYSTAVTYDTGLLLGTVCNELQASAPRSFPALAAEAAERMAARSGRDAQQQARWRSIGSIVVGALQHTCYYLTGVAELIYFEQFFGQLFTESALCQWQWLLIVGLLCLPVVQVPSFHDTRYAALLFGLLPLVLNVGVFLYEVVAVKPWLCAPGPTRDLWPKSAPHAAIGLSAFAYAFGGHGLYPEQIREMAQPQRWPRVMAYTYAFTVPLYWVCGLLGYYGYGDFAQANINLNFPDNAANRLSIAVQAVQELFFVLDSDLVVMLAIELAVGLDPSACAQPKWRGVVSPWLGRLGLRSAFLASQIFCAQMLLAGEGDTLLSLQSLTASVGMVAFTYFLPYVLHAILAPQPLSRARKVWAAVNVALGLVVMVAGFSSSLGDLVGSVGDAGLFAPGKCKLSYAYSPASPSDPCNISGIPTWAVD